MPNTRPESVSGSKPNPSEWLTVAEAVRFHHKRTPRSNPVHRSAVYRWIGDREHPVCGEWFGGELFVNRESLDAFCRYGRPRRGRRSAIAATADSRPAAAAIERMRRKHGIAPNPKGGEAA
ncbi:MAG: hypothetical protein RLZZ565_96 [Planctomycetota bacterium]